MRRAGWMVLMALAVTGCELDDGLDEQPFDAWVAGEWLITGRGRLEGCADPRFATDRFALRSLPLKVLHDPDTDALSLAEQPDRGDLRFFSGQVRGDRITFETREATADGVITFVFEGRARSNVTIEGTFEGTGPAACRSRGDFSVRVDCSAIGMCERPGPPRPDGGVDAEPDAEPDAAPPADAAQDAAPTADAALMSDAAPMADAAPAPDAAPAAGACEDDLPELAGFDPLDTFDGCRDDCFGNLTCAGACFAREVPVDADCAACLGRAVLCAAEECGACSNPRSEACLTCFAAECAAAFELCAGTPWP